MTIKQSHSNNIQSHSKINPEFLPNPDTAPKDLPPLGPDSILWQRFGDWRSMFVALYAATFQATQRDISTALVRQSNFFDNEVARLIRSAFPIIRTVYEGEEVGHMIRDYHHDVKGVHDDGSRWHSLSPDNYYWAHATFAAMPFALAGTFMDPLTDEEKEQLFQETRTWYSYYGVAEPADAPTSYKEYEAYMNEYITGKLSKTETVERSRILRRLDIPRPTPAVPNFIWRPLAPYVARFLVWVNNGLMPEHIRNVIGWEWTAKDQRRFKLLYTTIRYTFNRLPRKLRMVGIADRAFTNAGR